MPAAPKEEDLDKALRRQHKLLREIDALERDKKLIPNDAQAAKMARRHEVIAEILRLSRLLDERSSRIKCD